MKVEFYYDSTVPPGSTFTTDNAKAVDLVNQLAAKGVNAKAIDLKGEQVAFMTYNSALTGPKAQVRAVFGAKGEPSQPPWAKARGVPTIRMSAVTISAFSTELNFI